MNSKIAGVFAAATLGLSASVFAQGFTAGDLLVTTSTYEGTASMITPGVTVLPGGQTATADGAFPEVFNNDVADANFGVTSPIIIQQLTTTGAPANINISSPLVSGNTFSVPTSIMTTSFSSKSELSINLSTDGSAVTFMGYDTGINQLDTSNSNTPSDPAAPYGTTTATYREVVQLNANGSMSEATTNAYSTNNARAAILANGTYYTVGNGDALNFTGAETLAPGTVATPSTPNNVLGEYKSSLDNDKNGKDNNFRGETISNNTLYVSKGSGSKGVDTVYQVGATGTLPTGTGNTIAILPGLPGSTQASGIAATGTFAPFGIFVSGSTMYVADEGLAAPNPGTDVVGGGTNSYLSQAAADPVAGLEKWVYDGSKWNLEYTLQLGLNLGQQYAAYSGTEASLDPATVGLRNLTGKVNADGTVTLFATTATLSDLGDVGADPNKLVSITDTLADSTIAQASSESFSTLESATPGEVIRGVSFAPTAAVPEPKTLGMAVAGLALLLVFNRRRKGSLAR